MGQRKLHTKPEGKNPLGKARSKGRILSKWVLKRQGVAIWIGFIWLRIGISGGIL
jgi:hypothetical protein